MISNFKYLAVTLLFSVSGSASANSCDDFSILVGSDSNVIAEGCRDSDGFYPQGSVRINPYASATFLQRDDASILTELRCENYSETSQEVLINNDVLFSGWSDAVENRSDCHWLGNQYQCADKKKITLFCFSMVRQKIHSSSQFHAAVLVKNVREEKQHTEVEVVLKDWLASTAEAREQCIVNKLAVNRSLKFLVVPTNKEVILDSFNHPFTEKHADACIVEVLSREPLPYITTSDSFSIRLYD